VDDKEGHFIPRSGEYVTSRYKILRLLGQGTFGKVVECYDKKLRKYVAIKIIRAIQKYRDASQIEIRVLRTLRENDPNNENKCIHLLDTFNFKNHVCIVSELLGKSVFDFIKDNNFQPFPALHIWKFAKQLLQSVAFLHRLSLVHTDLKPENILLVNSEAGVVATSRRANAKRRNVLLNTEIRLIDFGSATFNEEFHSSVVSTRHYRAPEIILSMGWSFPCDVWSIGCILVEFFTGEALFQTHDNLEHLAMMEAVLGVMPDDYRRKAETYKPELFRNGALNYPNPDTTRSSRKYVRGMKKLQDIITTPNNSANYAKHNSRLLHLLRQLLEFDPNKRIKVADALKHPYFDLEEKDFPPI
jgi:dual-specificity kinase